MTQPVGLNYFTIFLQTIGMVTIGKLDTQLRRQHKQDELSYQAEQEEQNAIEGKNKY